MVETLMSAKNLDNFKTTKKDAMIAARELGYGIEVLDKLKKAKTEGEIRTIMANGRRERFG